MIESYNPNKVYVHCGWLNDHFFIWGEQKQHKKYQEYTNFQYPFLFSPFELKLLLFKYDETSFYGTLIETNKAHLLTPLKERMLYSAVGSIYIYESRPTDTTFLFPIEGITLTLEELPKYLNTILSLKNDDRIELAFDFRYWQKLFSALLDYIKQGKFLPSAYLTWEFASIDLTNWFHEMPDCCLSLYETRPTKLLSKEEKARVLEGKINKLCDAIIRYLLEEDQQVKQAFDIVKNQENAQLLSKLEKQKQQAHVDQQTLLEMIGAIPTAPFKTGIFITEGKQEQDDWQLTLFVQDRKDPAIIIYLSDLQTGNHPWRTNPIPRVKLDIEKLKKAIPFLEPLSLLQPVMFVSKAAVYEILTAYFQTITDLGFVLIAPAWWKQSPKSMYAQIQIHKNSNKIHWQQLADFQYQISIDNMTLSESEFQHLVKQKEPFVKINGKWIQWDSEQAEKLEQELNARKKQMTYLDLWKAYVTNEQHEKLSITFADDLALELQKIAEKQIDLIPQPKNLNGTLRPYQLEGASWLIHMRKAGFGACLADDMGLGKSIQTIAYMLSLLENETTPFLLICPTSLISNWQQECSKFAPSLKIYTHYGASRKQHDFFQSHIENINLVITSYNLALRDEHLFTSNEWAGLILDEAQHLKNFHTKQRKAIKKIKSRHTIALTGTPIENRLKELWSIIDLLNDRYLGSYRTFHETFVKPIEAEHNEKRLKDLQQLISPLLLRRTKNDPSLCLQLPKKQEQIVYVGLTVEQASLYQAVVNQLFTSIEESKPMEKRALILSSITKLKQICNHPAQFLKTDGPLEERSEKWELLCTLVEQMIAQKEKVLIFTQYKEMGLLLQKGLSQVFKTKVAFLHGNLTQIQRVQQISAFNHDDETNIFILSLKAGGVGLNLTAANHVIHYDRWWNPAVEQQATDRAYRIGQTKMVTVYKFVTKGTLEERINDLLEQKEKLTNSVLMAAEQSLTELSLDQLKELLTLTMEEGK